MSGNLMERQKDGVRSSVSCCLTRVLGTDQHARKVAEQELKTLEVTEEFGVVLAEMTASSGDPVQFRQLASILLKQYIESHWNSLSDKFVEPEVSDKSKVQIKELLPACLGDCHSKVRAAVAYAISTIAKWDWPSEWPTLFQQLVSFLQSGQPELVHGTMRVLNEFCHCVLDSQLPHVTNAILPHLLKVIVQADHYSVHTRTRAVHIYNILSGLVFSLTMTYPDSAELLLLPTMEQYLHAFVDILSSNNNDHGLRKEVIMTLCHLLRSYGGVLSQHIMGLVTPVWNILTQQTTVYVNSVVNSEEWLDETFDSDGEVIGQESSIFAVFEFINVLGESESYQSLLLPILPELLYLLLLYMQITQYQDQPFCPCREVVLFQRFVLFWSVLYQASCWLENVNQFVDEDENELSYSIRLSALDLVKSFLEEEDLVGPCYSAIIFAINKHLEENPPNTTAHWWKVHEACVLLCSVLVDGIKEQQVQFEVLNFMERVILPDIAANGSALLTGRCLWLAGKLSSLLPPSMLLKLLELVAGALQTSGQPVLRVLAAKAVYYFCSELKSTEHAQLLKTWLPSYLQCLCELAGRSPEDVVFLVIDSLQLVARMDVDVTAQCSTDIVPLAMSLFLHYSHDPGISSCVEELFEAISPNPGCHASLHAHIVPTCMDILTPCSSQLPLGLVAAVLEILVHVVRGSVVKHSAPIPATFVQEIFPVAVKRILDSSDSAILQNGGECVRAFVSVAAEQLMTWHDAMGCNGLQYVVKVILHLLDPSLPQFSASFVGKLILVFVRKAGSVLGTDLQILLRAVLSKMQSVNTSNVMQSLLLVFAGLLHTELEEIISFLSQVPDPSGQPALHYVLSEWCNRHPFIFGVYDSKVSTLALCKLLSYCVSTGDQRLMELKIEDEVAHNETMDSTEKWTQLHLPVKILKLLVHDLQKVSSSEESKDGGVWSEEGVDLTLEQLLLNAADYSQQWHAPVDPDELQDPVFQVDIKNHLTKYLQELTQQQYAYSLSTYLTQSEQNLLQFNK